MNSSRALFSYLNSFSPAEVEPPLKRAGEGWWSERVTAAISGDEPPDRSYWIHVWTGLLVKWAEASSRQWRGSEALVIGDLMSQVEVILWPGDARKPNVQQN